jgi:predicted phosphodiesterase
MSDLKLAIISDIHGNYTAFEAVLAELKSANVSKIVCLGETKRQRIGEGIETFAVIYLTSARPVARKDL